MSRTQVSRPLVAAIRPARPSDLPALGDFFAGLSVQTRYLRFFSPITPGPSLLNLLCGGDGTTDALLATRDGVIIGHGMAADVSGPCGGQDDRYRRGGGRRLAAPGRGLGAGARADHRRPGAGRDVGDDGRDARQRPGARHDQGSLARRAHPPFPGLQHALHPAGGRRAEPVACATRPTGPTRPTARAPVHHGGSGRHGAGVQFARPSSAIEATRAEMAAAWSSCGKCLPGMRSMRASPAAARALSP